MGAGKAAKYAIAILAVLVLSIFGVVVILTSDDEQPPANPCKPTGEVLTADKLGPGMSVGEWDSEQVGNAVAIIQAGAKLKVPARAQILAVMTAMDESRLIVVDHGDAAGPDSRGLFQQRDSWGPLSVRMDPAGSATLFYKALLAVPGWETMQPTLAAHAVQHNADPNVYTPFWPKAVDLVQALTVPGHGGKPAAVDAVATATGCDTGGNGLAVNAVATYVGPYSPAQLRARARKFVQAGGADPFFPGDPALADGSWLNDCQHFVANLSGREQSGIPSAADGWSQFTAEGVAHPANAIDGHAPPVGAWLYSRGPTGTVHVTVYLGNGLIASTDLFTTGRVGIGPFTALATKWHHTYLGWVAPWGTKVAVAAPLAPQGTGQTGAGLEQAKTAAHGPAAKAPGAVIISQANIPQRSGMGGYRASIHRVLSRHPDFVTLNEQTFRSDRQLTSPAPGYGVYRNHHVGHDAGASQTLETAVLYNARKWNLIAGGRVKTVDNDRVFYNRRPKIWDRFATWAMLRRRSDGAIVTVVSTHFPTNPAKYGPNRPHRRVLYGHGMDVLVQLVDVLSQRGPVLVGGDFNVHPNQIGSPWTAPAKMHAAGYRWYSEDLDYLFYRRGAHLLRTWTGRMRSDHPWISAQIGLD